MIEDLQELIAKAARSVAFQWPGIVAEDDLVQDISLHLLERPNSVEKLYEMDEGVRLKWLKTIGHQIASKERTDYEYFSGNFRYSVSEVKSLLSSGMLQELGDVLKSSWSAEEFIARSSGFEDALLTKTSMETDLRRGLHGLASDNGTYYAVIHARYLRGEELGDSDRKSLSRALGKLTDLMNRSFKKQHAERPDGPGTRRAISNAHAYVISSQQYSGGFDPGKTGANTDGRSWDR